MTQDMISLGFDQIIEQLKEQAVSAAARRILGETAPLMNEGLCRARMEETTAARRVMENAGTPPLAETEGTETGVSEALQGSMLLPAQLSSVARFCTAVRRLNRYLQNVQSCSAGIASWHTELPDLSALDPAKDRVLFIGQQSKATGMDFYSLRYELTPLYVGMIASWSLGEPYDGDDDWTARMDAETWRSLVYGSDYTHLYIYRADERFAADFGSCFEDPSRIGDDTLFRIERNGGTAVFTAE